MVFVEMSRPGGTRAGGDVDQALKRRAIVGLSLWDEKSAGRRTDLHFVGDLLRSVVTWS